MNELTNYLKDYDEEVIQQDHKRGPGWFLKISYIIITLFCLYYLFTFWDWKSSYDKQQTKIETELKR
jgi:hypothetical protein